MNKVICHQYATGRGTTGYGFIAYSKEKETEVNASFSFSLNKCVGLRFARLSAGTDYVMEVDPVTADYQYTGVFCTRKRVEAGSSSIFTHSAPLTSVSIFCTFFIKYLSLTPQYYILLTK